MREVIGKSVAGVVADFLSLGFVHNIVKKKKRKKKLIFLQAGVSGAVFSLVNFVVGFLISALGVVLGVPAGFPIPGGRV